MWNANILWFQATCLILEADYPLWKLDSQSNLQLKHQHTHIFMTSSNAFFFLQKRLVLTRLLFSLPINKFVAAQAELLMTDLVRKNRHLFTNIFKKLSVKAKASESNRRSPFLDLPFFFFFSSLIGRIYRVILPLFSSPAQCSLHPRQCFLVSRKQNALPSRFSLLSQETKTTYCCSALCGFLYHEVQLLQSTFKSTSQ